MFASEERPATGRYRVKLVSGELRQSSHERNVQAALDEGSAMGWQLTSATTTNASGTYVTALYWDTTPQR